MQIDNQLEEYILAHIDAEPDLLKKIDRDTHLKMLHTNMHSGHLQGRLLKMFTQMIRPQRILEIGTFVGYSTLCFAEGLEEGGEIHTLEIDDELEDVIRANFANSEHGHKIKLHIGDALDILPSFDENSFDLAFIDGNKEVYWSHYEALLPKVKVEIYRQTTHFGMEKCYRRCIQVTILPRNSEFNSKLSATVGWRKLYYLYETG